MHPLTTDFAEQILALIKVQAYSLLGAVQDNKVVLGGSAGSAGGTGDPPAGFVGQLIQSNITFDTAGSTRACTAGSAGSSSLVDNLDAIRLGLEICDDAIQERHVDWGTGSNQVSAFDMPFASTSGSIVATNVRDAIEEARGSGGSVTDHGLLSGLGDDDHTQYLLADGTRELTGDWDAGANTVTFGDGIAFDGSSGSNFVTVPDNVAQALNLVDAGGLEYMRVVSTDAQPVIDFNNAGADIDIYLRSVGVNALFAQGSDGALTVGGPTLTVPGDWWVGFGPAAARVVVDGSGSNIAVMNANLGIFTATPDDRVEVVGAGMLISDTKADSANKTMRFGCQHWDIDEEPVYFAVISNTAAANSCRMGGSTGAGNAATDVRIFTAANTTTVSGTERVQVATTGDVLIGTTTAPTANSGRVLAFGDNAAQPTMGANTGGIYGYDPTTGTVEMYAVDEAGNDALLTPHRFELFQPDPAEAYPFAYWATNKFLGKKVNVDMSGMVREVERLSGKQFLYEQDIPALDWSEQQQIAKQSVEASRLIDALMRDMEITKTEALEYVEETKEEPTGKMVKTGRYILVGDQVIEEEVPETIDVPTGRRVWQMRETVRFERRNGKFYRLPREDEVAIEPYLPKDPPQWMKDRL